MKIAQNISRRGFLTTAAAGTTGLATGCATEPAVIEEDNASVSPTLEGIGDAPPPTGLILHVEPMIAGTRRWVHVEGCEPGATVHFLMGFPEGDAFCPPILGDDCLGPGRPLQALGRRVANEHGEAGLPVEVPADLIGRDVQFQVASPSSDGIRLSATVLATTLAVGSDPSIICAPTPDDVLGPFYLPDMPVRTELDVHGDVGTSLYLTGRVLDENCQPIRQGAVVEIWQADPDGGYDMDDLTRPYRATLPCDIHGAYAVHTLVPGHYLNGSNYRPAHLHIKIWVDGVEKLTTQLYFEGDPYFDVDPFWEPELIMPVSVVDGAWICNFDASV
jgi:protocatechuate 3,4-dioxygenase beta subunit